MIKILYITMSLPYDAVGHAGGKTLNYYIKSLSASSDFEVKLVTFCSENDINKADGSKYGIDEHLIIRRKDLKNFLGNLSSVNSKYNPLHKNGNIITSYAEYLVLQKLKQLKKAKYYPDIIVLEWTQMVLLIDKIKKMFPSAKYIASEHDVTFVGFQRKIGFYSGIRRFLWKVRFENEKKRELCALKNCDLVLLHNRDNEVLLTSAGINEDKIQWLVPYYDDLSECRRLPNGRDILFFGAMSRKENYLSAVWFIERVMPLLNDMDIRFVILGSNPPDFLKKLESESVLVTGFVESIVPYFENSVCFVAPLVLGAGIKVKVIEALSSGIPVLTNEIGIEGIPAENDKEYIYCSTPEDYEKAIRRIFDGKYFEEQFGLTSKRFIKNNFSLEASVEQYKNKLTELGERK